MHLLEGSGVQQELQGVVPSRRTGLHAFVCSTSISERGLRAIEATHFLWCCIIYFSQLCPYLTAIVQYLESLNLSIAPF